MFKRVNRKDGKRMNEPLIAPTATMDIYSLQDTTISVHAEISRGVLGANLFSLRESKLRVHITNNGESPLENISVEASAPEGTQLVDPGILFGNQRRHVRLPRLQPNKSVTYKLGIRAKEGFASGVLVISLTQIDIYSAKSSVTLHVGLTSL
jgi:uncharacterized membrane protein